jgi:IclR family pca regulon transcriptional regulator
MDPALSTPAGPDGDFVTALARGLEVLEAFSADAAEMTLSEVAQRTGLSPATVRRSLLTFERLGYVTRNGRRFLLTARVLGLGAAYARSMNLRDVAHQHLTGLVTAFDDAASMTILDRNDVVYIAHVPPQRGSLVRHHVGARLPAHATSTGHVLLAQLDAAALEAYLAQAPFPRFTSRTPVQAEQVRKAVDAARRHGHAVVQDTVEYGAVAIAVPVHDGQGRVVAAINSSSDSARTDAVAIRQQRLTVLQDTAALISETLQRYPTLARSIGR